MTTAAKKPERLYFKTYLQMIRNAVGTEMFRNFYIRDPDGKEYDAMNDGEDSCAFFVSGVLTMLGKLSDVHGTVAETRKDLEKSGWYPVIGDFQPGNVLVWEAKEFDDGPQEHIGFYIGDDKAVSTSWTERRVVEHDIHFAELNRAVTHAYRFPSWET